MRSCGCSDRTCDSRGTAEFRKWNRADRLLDFTWALGIIAAQPMARLVLLSEGLTGRTFELKSDKTTVGRVSDNMFEIPEASISSHHAEILLRGNDVVI